MNELLIMFGTPKSGNINPSQNDPIVENLWEELENVSFDEDADGRLYLSQPWHDFPAGTEREEIWHWFDETHSKGVAWLLYEYESFPNTHNGKDFN